MTYTLRDAYQEFTDTHHSIPLVEALLHSHLNRVPSLPVDPTPDGYGYVPYAGGGSTKPLEGETLFLSPHPSDVSADFFPGLIHMICNQGSQCRQLLLTRGEKGGDPGSSEAETIAIRREEEVRSAAVTGINTDFLTRKNGTHDFFDPSPEFYFPDGELMQHLPELTGRLKAHIRDHPPARLGLPSLYPDHPDHLATALAALNAVLQLREEGFFRNHPPIEIFTSDPEFAVALGQPWAVEAIARMNANGAGAAHAGLRDFHYWLRRDPETGRIMPAPDITQPGAEDFHLDHPIATPPYILAITDRAYRTKITALGHHVTQMNGDAAYDRLIPAADRMRGLQLPETAGHRWGLGFFPIHIPGVTPPIHDAAPEGVTQAASLLDTLPRGSVFQLQHLHN